MKNRSVLTEEDVPPEVIRAIEQGRKVEAIKLLQEQAGLGLANAKVLVDKVARQRGIAPRRPGRVEEASAASGVLRLLLVAVALFALYWFYKGA